MEKIKALWVGKNKFPSLAELEEDYSRKISLMVPFLLQTLKDPPRGISEKRATEWENQRILEAIDDGDNVIALDERGRTFDSLGFAHWLEGLLIAHRRTVFLVGGASGWTEPVKKRAQGLLSLSPLTLCHDLARVVFLEQLYRGLTIRGGLPYHR